MTDHDVTDGNGILPCFDPLPPARPVPDYAGKTRLHEQLLVKVSCAASELDESWRIIGIRRTADLPAARRGRKDSV